MKSPRVTGEARKALAAEAARLYTEENLTVAEVGVKLEMSYGKTHALLREAGVPRRKRGRGQADR